MGRGALSSLVCPGQNSQWSRLHGQGHSGHSCVSWAEHSPWSPHPLAGALSEVPPPWAGTLWAVLHSLGGGTPAEREAFRLSDHRLTPSLPPTHSGPGPDSLRRPAPIPHAAVHLRPAHALPRRLHLLAARHVGHWHRHVSHELRFSLPHLPAATLSRLVAGPGRAFPDQLALLPPILRHLRRLLPVLHGGRRALAPAHPAALHQCVHGRRTAQPQPPQPERRGGDRGQSQQLAHQHATRAPGGGGVAALLSAFEGLSPTAPAVHAQTPARRALEANRKIPGGKL